MKLAQSMLVALLGSILSLPAGAEEILSTPEMFSTLDLADVTPYADQATPVTLSCGFQGTLDAKEAKVAPTQAQMIDALTKAATACGAIMNTAAQEHYSQKAAVCTESKDNCSAEDYKELHQAWCGHMHIHPVHTGEPIPAHWAKSMDTLIAKAQKACMASTNPEEVEVATTYFETYKPGLCASEHVPTEQMHAAPDGCLSMYHAIGANGAPY